MAEMQWRVESDEWRECRSGCAGRLGSETGKAKWRLRVKGGFEARYHEVCYYRWR